MAGQKMQREVSGVMFSYYDKGDASEFHQKCVPTNRQTRGGAPPPAASSQGSVQDYDVVTADKIWKQSVKKEWDGAKTWGANWGFLAEYDEKGNKKDEGELKPPKEMPEKVNMFSEAVPNTNAGNYGNRQSTEIGVTMQQLEFKFHSQNRRKKLGNDLVCY